MVLASSTLTKIVVLWIWFYAPGVMGDLPRTGDDWHVWGAYPNFEMCEQGMIEARADRVKNGYEDLLLGICKEQPNLRYSPLLVLHKGGDEIHFREHSNDSGRDLGQAG